MTKTGDWLDYACDRPEWSLEQCTAGEAERSFLAFCELMWPVLSPTRPLIIGKATEALAEHLVALVMGQIEKLCVALPPSMGKSMLISTLLDAWIWGPLGRPSFQGLHWSYSAQLAIRDNVYFRDVINSEIYQRLWGHRFRLSGDQNEKVLIRNDQRGYKQAAGIHGTATGLKGDGLVIDDAHQMLKAESEADRRSTVRFVSEVYPTRGNGPSAWRLIVGQRCHPDDAIGAVLKAELGYEVLCLPMRYERNHPIPSRTSLGFTDWRTEEGELLFPERFDEDAVQELETSLSLSGGQFAVRAQLQQRPEIRGGGMFRREWFDVVDELPADLVVCRGWDLAATSAAENPRAAFTAGVKLGFSPADGRYYVLDVRRVRAGPAEVSNLIKRTAAQDGFDCPQDLPQDPGAAGKTQKQALSALLTGYDVRVSPETGGKSARARPFAAQAENRNVALLRGDWNEAYLNELEECRDTPNKNRDGFWDQMDATSRAWGRVLAMTAGGPVDFVRPEVY